MEIFGGTFKATNGIKYIGLGTEIADTDVITIDGGNLDLADAALIEPAGG